ncbi:hypothetical protein DFH08DRAFT_1024261 [Mycena albidolilacea]|uniref:FAD/NAD(P)-binding domain-containing protein n=1 Tax=Mycena albidolilacea TaxID=1033008 RepID=A0AAD7AL71_9AGAR|nr:hypothetical protein DFH08DRAFT_1024261 [Mycena albidolilacea]
MGISHSSVYLASTAFALLGSGIVWQKVCSSPPEWIKELDMMGQPRKQKLFGTAVVCGGSIAGTVAARILADHFERVILVDPELHDIEKPRTRIMQYNATHALLSLFIDGARRLWPNLTRNLRPRADVYADLQLHYSGITVPAPYWDYPGGHLPDTLAMRRSTTQPTLYKLLMQHPSANITVWPGTVRGVTASDNKTFIRSVLIRKLDGTEIAVNDVNLAVDCTGRMQAGMKWLETAGFSLPENLRVSYKPNIRYATLCFTVSPELESRLPIPEYALNSVCAYIHSQHFTHGLSVTALLKTDNNTMQVMLTSCEDNLPRSVPEILPFMATIRGHEPLAPWFVETVEMLCEHCDSPSFDIIKIPEQSYVKYNSVPAGDLPSNFIAVGDAHIQLNPVHGQGVAKIMLNAITLNSLLHSIDSPALPRDFSARYFKKNADRTEGLWDATRLHDYGSSDCEPMAGETRDDGRFARWFELKLISAAMQHQEVASVLWRVRNMIAAERALLAPTVLWKALWTRSRF